MKRELTAWPAVLGLCALVACELGEGDGNGGGPGLGPEQTVTVGSTATLDGWVRDNGDAGPTGSQVIAGDLLTSGVYRGYRGFYSFDITSIPTGSSVTSANLRLYQLSFNGAPYVELGNVIVESVDYGASLDPPDYGAAPLAPAIGTLSNNTATEYKTLIVTGAVQADVAAARTGAQFRLRFSNTDNNNDGSADNVTFTDVEWPVAANRPELVVKYRPPATP